ncbi:MAG TPA: hypothetical protein DFI00_10170 [Rhodospirillaceae bacterium]|nr:hypothetical protein [Alphaproteobacteria bacterium]MAX94518.1 hypothetical protein [Alphaproteobacteria bacterium]MBN54470.1 hypothetical protein [Alphaproteobacteria bacterium]HCI47647.1 hypothetical protein [Rhodospirillaceae bacterium]|tara:strand:- start:27678 stop:28097 length:420 start_codon:yes stop_codon:yes gene_type:complete
MTWIKAAISAVASGWQWIVLAAGIGVLVAGVLAFRSYIGRVEAAAVNGYRAAVVADAKAREIAGLQSEIARLKRIETDLMALAEQRRIINQTIDDIVREVNEADDPFGAYFGRLLEHDAAAGGGRVSAAGTASGGVHGQ